MDVDGAEEYDPDKYYRKPIPLIKRTFSENIAKAPIDQQSKLNNAVDHAFNKINMFTLGGRWMSARLMTRFLEGKGGYDIMSYRSIQKSSDYIGRISFYNSISYVREDIKKAVTAYAQGLKKEGTYNYTAISQTDRGQSAAALGDIGTSFGSYKILGKGDAYIHVDKNGKYSTTLTIYYTLADKYQWKEGKGISEDEFVDHDKMILLQKIGARPFYIRIYFEATYKGENGELKKMGDIKDSKADWSWDQDEKGNVHKNELSNPEPRKGNGYAMPEEDSSKKGKRSSRRIIKSIL